MASVRVLKLSRVRAGHSRKRPQRSRHAVSEPEGRLEAGSTSVPFGCLVGADEIQFVLLGQTAQATDGPL